MSRHEGGLKAAATNKSKYGKDFYSKIGKMGGETKHPETRYFTTHPEVASSAGKKGGPIDKRSKDGFWTPEEIIQIKKRRWYQR